MKRRRRTIGVIATATVLLAAVGIGGNVETVRADSVEINTANFPDDSFRDWVEDQYDSDHDGYLSDEENTATEMYLDNHEIHSLKGIEFFTDLQTLSCEKNYLTDLDLSKNINLCIFDCSDNDLSNLNLGSDNTL